jgi:ADP-heptose:LPS heptosyltransferase
MRQAVLFVGNDELWLHLAAAAGIPTFGLFGPSDETEAPIGGHVLAIRGPRTLADIQMIDPKLKQNVCHMLDLTIDHVAAVIERGMAG